MIEEMHTFCLHNLFLATQCGRLAPERQGAAGGWKNLSIFRHTPTPSSSTQVCLALRVNLQLWSVTMQLIKSFPSLTVSRTNFCSHLISTKSDKYLGQEKGHKSVDRSNWNLRALFVRTKRATWCRPPCRKPIKNCFQLASACTFGADTLCSSFHYPIPSGP